MDQPIIYFDVAAVVVTLICLISLVFRRKTRGPVNGVYLGCVLLVLVTALASVAGEVIDELGLPFLADAVPESERYLLALRSSAKLLYYTLRCVTAPAYLVLIAVISDTAHRLNRPGPRRLLLWVPMLAAVAVVLTNPLHHQVFSAVDGHLQRGSLIGVVYVVSLYYAAIGIAWLMRWRSILDSDAFATLMLLYPIVFSAVAVQYVLPYMRVEMFATSVVLMLLSAFIIRPELHLDSQVDAASLHAYREMSRRAFATGKRLCLVYLEIVNLEQLRELLGKDEMQDLVGTVAHRLNGTLERGDVLYYLRNGLFCISSRNLDAEHALGIARAMHEEGKRRAEEQSGDESVSFEMRSCVVRVPEDVPDEATLRNFVHRLAHLVPTSAVTTFEELSQRSDFRLQMALSEVVARALKDRSFEVYYQPICCLADGGFHSAEALVRLKDPEYGWVSPGLFIPEAEQTGAIVAIGSQLLEKVFDFLGEVDFERLGLRYVEVNLSVEQCIRPDMARQLLALAEQYQVSPSQVNLEITETSSSYSQGIMARSVRTLAEAGFTFSLDDYGTGYSSAARALALPFSLIKFDKSFVDGLDDPHTRLVLDRSIDMMRSIGKEVLVEGVETAEQAEALRAMGADYIQGFYYAKPLPQDEFVAFLAERA